jgi:hypothetical protein
VNILEAANFARTMPNPRRKFYRRQMRRQAYRWMEAVGTFQWETAAIALINAVYYRGLSGGAK